MFDKFKQLKQLRDLQSLIKKETVELERDGIKVVVNGEMKIEFLRLSSDLTAEEQGDKVKSLINDAMKEVQKKISAVMQQNGGLPGMM